MVLTHYGQHDARGIMRRVVGYPSGGQTLEDLIAVADACGLDASAFDISIEDLASLPMPAILHWRSGHFVVLEWLGGTDASIVDPARGRRCMHRDELVREFSGIALAFETRDDTRRQTDVALRAGTWHPLVDALRRERSILKVIVLLSVVESMSLLAALHFVASVAAELLETGTLAWLALASGVSGLVGAAAVHFAANRCGLKLVHNVSGRLASMFTSAVIAAPARFLMTRSDRYLADLAEDLDPSMNVGAPTPQPWYGATVGVLLICGASRYSMPAAIMIAVVSMTLALSPAWSDAKLDASVELSLRSMYLARFYLRSIFLRIESVLATGRLSDELEQWLRTRNGAESVDVPRVYRLAPSRRWKAMLAAAVLCVSLLMMYQHRAFSLPTLFALLGVAGFTILLFYDFCSDLAKFMRWRRTFEQLSELQKEAMVNSEPSREQDAAEMPARHTEGHRSAPDKMGDGYIVEMYDVSYSPPSSAAEIIPAPPLRIKRGEAWAVIDRRGSGASMIARLALGLDEPLTGRVCIAGTRPDPRAEVNGRRIIAGVLESAEPPGGSILVGFSSSRVNVTRDQVLSLCSQLGLEAWLHGSPLGEFTPVMRTGGRERAYRRILVLAALLVEPPHVLVLDGILDDLDIEMSRRITSYLTGRCTAILLCTSRPEIVPLGYKRLELRR